MNHMGKTLKDYIDHALALESVQQAKPLPAACYDLVIAAENFRRQTSRAEVDPGSRESARSAGIRLDAAIAAARVSILANREPAPAFRRRGAEVSQ